jgi:hypothetical protein
MKSTHYQPELRRELRIFIFVPDPQPFDAPVFA